MLFLAAQPTAKTSPQLSFHSFPSAVELKKQCLAKIRRDEAPRNICSLCVRRYVHATFLKQITALVDESEPDKLIGSSAGCPQVLCQASSSAFLSICDRRLRRGRSQLNVCLWNLRLKSVASVLWRHHLMLILLTPLMFLFQFVIVIVNVLAL